MKINYEPFEGQTSSAEDLYLFGFLKQSLVPLLTHYDEEVRREARKLKQLPVATARRRVRRYHHYRDIY